MKKSKKPRKIKQEDLANPFGKTTVVTLLWKDWRKELPKSGDRVYLIIKSKNGLVSVTGYYLDETFPASGSFPESRWQQFRLDDCGGTIIIGGEGEECLVAWAKPKKIGKLLNDPCTICQTFPCVC